MGSERLVAGIRADDPKLPPPDPNIAFEHAREHQAERLGRLVRGVTVDLDRVAIEERVEIRRDAGLRLGVDGQGLQHRPDDAHEQPIDVRLKGPRQVAGRWCVRSHWGSPPHTDRAGSPS